MSIPEMNFLFPQRKGENDAKETGGSCLTGEPLTRSVVVVD